MASAAAMPAKPAGNRKRPLGEVDPNHAKRHAPHKKPPAFCLIRKNKLIGSHRCPRDWHDTPCVCVPPSRGGEGCGEDCLNRATNVECCPSTCPCGDECRNQAMQRNHGPRTRVVYMGKKGWGLVTRDFVPRGQFVIEYLGEVCTTAEMDKRIVQYELEKLCHTFVMDLSADYVIDATKKGGKSRFINHSCEPNCKTSKWQIGSQVRVGIFALQDINPGEELSYHYNMAWNGGKRIHCECGAPSCHGFLGGHSEDFKQALMEDQEDEADGRKWWYGHDGTKYPMDDLDMYDSTSEERAEFQREKEFRSDEQAQSAPPPPPPPLPAVQQ